MWYESTHKQAYLEESLFLVSKVLFSDCQTLFPIGLQVTWKQSLYSLEDSLKNLHKWWWLLTYSLRTFYNSVHLGEVLFRSVCSANIESAAKDLRASSAFVEPVSVCASWLWVLGASAHAALGECQSSFDVLKCSVLSSTFPSHVILFCPLFLQTGCSTVSQWQQLCCNIAEPKFSPWEGFLIASIGVLIVGELLITEIMPDAWNPHMMAKQLRTRRLLCKEIYQVEF